jgi:DNA polymerase
MDDLAQTFWRGLLVEPECEGCPLEGSKKVPPEGNPRARIALVGEGPGQNEEMQGRPFVGAAGQVLNLILQRAGIVRSDLWVSNSTLCRKKSVVYKNTLISPDKALRIASEHCRSRLIGELAIVQPKVIVPIGGLALRALTGDQANTLGGRRGGIHPFDVLDELAKIREDG